MNQLNQVNQVNSSKLSYRADIDGLRAIAVISVILYHAQLKRFGIDWFEGGFIGVDIFFVISGYLITHIILSELQTKGSFSYLSFYERRARRILPMLFVVIFASIPFAWQLLLSSDFEEYAESILASLFFGSNFFFYHSTTEYGADSALLKPFLHTWSLGVEEQFYLVFPIIAIVAFRCFQQYFLYFLFALSLLSLVFSELMEVRNSDMNFYLPFSRFWELAVGSMLAFRGLNNKISNKSVGAQKLPILGFCLVAFSILFFDSTTPHPSFYTLIPIIGVALIIGFSSDDEVVGKVLGSKPFVWVGLISYSAYLWHFPIFAFGRLDGEFAIKEKLFLFILVFILSFFSYHLVEKPFRKIKVIGSKLFLAIILSLSFILTVGFGYSYVSNGFEQRFSEKQLDIFQYFLHREYSALKDLSGNKGLVLREQEYSDSCYSRSPLDPCKFGEEKIVFLGDSFVGHFERAIMSRTSDLGAISLTYGQCPFVSDEIWFGGRAECPIVNQLRKEKINTFTDKKIFIISANYEKFQKSKLRTNKPLRDGRNGVSFGVRADDRLAWDSYFDNIDWLLGLGHRVVLIGFLPQPSIASQGWVMKNKHLIENKSYPNVFNQTVASDLAKKNIERFSDIKNKNLIFVEPSELLCDASTDRCLDVKLGVGPLYNGGGHLSYYGADLIAERIQSALQISGEK